MDDQDTVGENWVHWILYNIPANRTDLPEAVKIGDTIEGIGVQGMNSFQEVGYRGPCPPLGMGEHHYQFKLYALDIRLFLPPGATISDIQKAMQGHILSKAGVIGTYQRNIKREGG
jgi:Raf kinase inhibitor-like YbhB/YbcL family protein